MYPVGGFVFIAQLHDWSGSVISEQQGPYKILGYEQLFDTSDRYYELDGGTRFYTDGELLPASKEEALHHKMTGDIHV